MLKYEYEYNFPIARQQKSEKIVSTLNLKNEYPDPVSVKQCLLTATRVDNKYEVCLVHRN